MAKELLKIGLAIEYDPDENQGIPPAIFLYQFVNRLNYEYPVKSIRLNGIEKEFENPEDVTEVELKNGTVEIIGKPFKEN